MAAPAITAPPDLGQLRGLSPTTMQTFNVRNNDTGWKYDTKCMDGRIVTRWKSYLSQRPEGDENWKKYLWIPERPDTAKYFYPPGLSLKQAVDDAWGELWFVGGDIGVMTMFEIGMVNTTGTFGVSFPDTFLEDMKALNVGHIRLIPDRDQGDQSWAVKVRDALKDQLDIKFTVYALPYSFDKSHGKDINDYWLDSDRNAQAFREGLYNLSEWVLPEPEPVTEFKFSSGDAVDLPPTFIEAIERALNVDPHFNGEGWSRKNVHCLFHDDKTPSATWNHQMGILRCHTCGESFLSKAVGEKLGIRMADFLDSTPRVPMATAKEWAEPVKSTVAVKATVQQLRPALSPDAELTPEQKVIAKSGRVWLDDYMNWARESCPLTPDGFHEAMALWLLATTSTRRMRFTSAGEKIYPNLYILIVGETSIYRKTTAMKQALNILREAHLEALLLPEDSTPEALFNELAGRKPAFFEDLTHEDQQEWLLGRAVAAQRAVFKDECSSIFANMRKDYNAGLPEILLQGYDSDGKSLRKLLKSQGLIIVRDLSLSFLGATTPVMFAKSITTEESENGFLARFAVVTPDGPAVWKETADTVEIPKKLVDQLRRLFMDLLPWHNGEKPKGTDALSKEVTSPPVMDVYADAEAIRQMKAYRKVVGFDMPNSADLGDSKAASYSRLGTMMVKVAMLLAAIDTEYGQIRIQAKHAYAAQEIIEDWRESLHRLDRQIAKVGGQLHDKLLKYLRSTGATGASITDIKRDNGIKTNRGEVERILTDLGEDGLIEKFEMERKAGTRGRKSIRYRVVQDTVN